MAGLCDPTTIVLAAEPVQFVHGKGRKLSIQDDQSRPITLRFAGTLPFGLSAPFEGSANPSRRALVVNVGEPADAVGNAAVLEWSERASEHILNHIVEHAGAIFPGTPATLLQKRGFSMIQDLHGSRTLKVRLNLDSSTVLVPDPNAAATPDSLPTLQVPNEMFGDVLVRGAHADVQAKLSFIWLDESMQYGCSIDVDRLIVTPPPPRPAQSIGEFSESIPWLNLSAPPKKYAGGAGRYVPAALDGGYPAFALSDVVGGFGAGITARFDASAPKEKPESTQLSVPLSVPEDSPVWRTLRQLDARIIDTACSEAGRSWFNYPMDAETAACIFRSPCKHKEGYDPLVYLRINTVDMPGREATRIWLVPSGADERSMTDALTMPHGFASGTAADVVRGAGLAAVVSMSCVWLQTQTFGWSLNATDIFVHSTAGSALELDGRAVTVGAVATAADIAACFGRKRALEPDLPCGYSCGSPPCPLSEMTY